MSEQANPPRHVYFWQNGMVMTFGADGRQMPELQGRDTPELRAAIAARADGETVYHEGAVWLRPSEWLMEV
jgi:hypothetical protein